MIRLIDGTPWTGHPAGMIAIDILDRLFEHSPSLAHALINRVIPSMIPLAGGLGIRVHDCTPTRAELSLPLKKRTRNHVGAIYIGAQMTLADITSGVLIFRNFPPGPFSFLIKTAEAQFIAKGKTSLRCIAEMPEELGRSLNEVRTNDSGKAEGWLPLNLFDEQGQVVTRVRFLVAVKRFGEPKAG